MPNAKIHEIDLAKIKNPNINKTQIIVFDEDKPTVLLAPSTKQEEKFDGKYINNVKHA